MRAQVTVDLDSGATEEAHEQYKPDSAVVRSEQSSEENSRSGGAANGGIPGALTNQPPAGGAVAAAKPAAQHQQAAGHRRGRRRRPAPLRPAAAAAACGCQRDAGELVQAEHAQLRDRSHRQLLAPAGRTRQARHGGGAGGQRAPGGPPTAKPRERPLTKAEIEDITRLVKDAVGFDEARGDSVNVVNQPLQPQVVDTLKPEVVPLWQRPWLQSLVRLVLGALVLVALALGVLRPLIKNLSTHALAAPAPGLLAAGAGPPEERGVTPAVPGQPLAYEQQLVQARGLVTQDPKRVAQVVKTWVGEQ